MTVKTSDFDYELPGELIAQQPLADRAASRMMVVNPATGDIRHDEFRNLSRYLHPGDLLVLNDTKVIPARIWSESPALEFLLVENLGGNRWSALVKPGRKAKPGTALVFADGLTAVIEGNADFGGRVLRFSGNVEPFLAKHGAAPLPPYIKRAIPRSTRYQDRESTGRASLPASRGSAGVPTGVASPSRTSPSQQSLGRSTGTDDRAQDLPRYQTVFAHTPGAIAAPTAGLHFTPELLAQFPHTFLTLHVGLGTFRPVKVENVEDHPMHAERFSVSAEAVAAITQAQRVVAVGTTVVRTLETIAPLLLHSRAPFSGSTDIFIRPPFTFRVVDVLLTNFHLPRSTLLMLVSAFAGRELILRAYAEAVRERYRFFSYGDCMLVTASG